MKNLTNQDVIELIKPLLEDEPWRITGTLTQVLGNIFKSMTAKESLEQITSLLKDDNADVRYSVIRFLEYVLDIDQTFANKELLEQIKPLLKDQRRIANSSIKVLDKMVLVDPTLANKESLEQIIQLLKNECCDVRSSARNALVSIARADANLAEYALEQIIALIDCSYIDTEQERSVIIALDKVLNINPSLNNQAYQQIKLLLFKKRGTALEVLAKIIVLDSSFATEAYEQIIPFLNSSRFWYVKLAIDVLRKILKIEPSFATDIYNQITPFIKDNHCTLITVSVIEILGDVVKVDPNLVNQEVLDIIKLFLTHKDVDVRISANYFTGLIAGICSTLEYY